MRNLHILHIRNEHRDSVDYASLKNMFRLLKCNVKRGVK